MSFEHMISTEHVRLATGMVATQFDCSPAEALGRMRIVAMSTHQELGLIALDVLDGIIRFDPSTSS